MNEISGVISGLGETSSSDSNKSVLSQDDFLKIMIAELTNQDPLEPLDNSEFLNQLTQIQTLEATTRLSDGIQSLILGQQITTAGVLIGRGVIGVDATGAPVEGIVDRIILQDGEVLLGVGDSTLPIGNVRQVNGAVETESE